MRQLFAILTFLLPIPAWAASVPFTIDLELAAFWQPSGMADPTFDGFFSDAGSFSVDGNLLRTGTVQISTTRIGNFVLRLPDGSRVDGLQDSFCVAFSAPGQPRVPDCGLFRFTDGAFVGVDSAIPGGLTAPTTNGNFLAFAGPSVTLIRPSVPVSTHPVAGGIGLAGGNLSVRSASPVPEPSPSVLTAAGLILALLVGGWKARSRRTSGATLVAPRGL